MCLNDSTGSPSSILTRMLEASIRAKQALLDNDDLLARFNSAAEAIAQVYLKGGRLYIAGNGGSAADAQHLAAELVCRFAKDRNPLPAEALTVDSSILTAISNDYGYEHVFSRQLAGKMRPGDIFLGISTSGNSANIIAALNTCREMKLPCIALTGPAGGVCAELADYCIRTPGDETSTIQELHIVVVHALCACLEQRLFCAG